MTNNISRSLPPVVLSLSLSILLIPSRPWYVYVSFFFIIISFTLMIINLKIMYTYEWIWRLDVLRIINEPTAAAIAYGLDSQPSIDRISNLQVRIPLDLKMSYSFSFCSAFNSMFKVSRWTMWVTSRLFLYHGKSKPQHLKPSSGCLKSPHGRGPLPMLMIYHVPRHHWTAEQRVDQTFLFMIARHSSRLLSLKLRLRLQMDRFISRKLLPKALLCWVV